MIKASNIETTTTATDDYLYPLDYLSETDDSNDKDFNIDELTDKTDIDDDDEASNLAILSEELKNREVDTEENNHQPLSKQIKVCIFEENNIELKFKSGFMNKMLDFTGIKKIW